MRYTTLDGRNVDPKDVQTRTVSGKPLGWLEGRWHEVRPTSNGHKSRNMEQDGTPLTRDVPTVPSVPSLRGEEIDGGQLLDEIATFVSRFVWFQMPSHAETVALWVLHTHASTAFDVTPYLFVNSPERESGKSRLVTEVLPLLVAKPWVTTHASEATIYRKVDKDCPTLLFDEIDGIFSKNSERQELRSLLNAGFKKGVSVPRCVGEGKNLEVKDFEVFSPKAFAGIGNTLGDTLASRVINIRLQRKTREESLERFRERVVSKEAEPIRERAAAWASAHFEKLQEAWPELPEELTDRQQDAWEPLLAIADEVGGTWSGRARAAAVELHSDEQTEASLGVLLLTHMREALGDKDRISTDGLLHVLIDRDDAPWAEWWGRAVEDGKTKGPAARLSRILKPFGIEPKKMREGTSSVRGYELEDGLDEAFRRYLPTFSPAKTEQTEQRNTAGQSTIQKLGFGAENGV